MNESLFIEVLLDLPLEENKTYVYKIPEDIKDQVFIGSIVLVSFGNIKETKGIVTGFTKFPPDKEIKFIKGVIPDTILDSRYLELFEWISSYYLCPLSLVFKTVILPGIISKTKRVIEILGSYENYINQIKKYKGSKEFYSFCINISRNYPKMQSLYSLYQKFGKNTNQFLRILQNNKLIRIITIEESIKSKEVLYVTLLKTDYQDLTKRQIEILDILKSEGSNLPLQKLTSLAKTSSNTITKLGERGYVSIHNQRVWRKPYSIDISEKPPLELTPAQSHVIYKIKDILNNNNQPQVILLHGVTGSGKTEIYIRVISEVINNGGQALVLVPEISLTPQIVSRFRTRFDEKVAVFHSKLSVGERFDEWQRIYNGVASVVIGTRSAIFAPVNNLKLIIIDEEHDSSYKQDQNSPRYNAIKVALKRAEIWKCPVILGSATPSIEDYYYSTSPQKTNWHLLELPERIENYPLPPIKIIDMRSELRDGNRSIFSRELKKELQLRLEKKEQSILFINRRGFSNFVLCRSCGYVMNCPHCSVSLTHHITTQNLKCHYCDYSTFPPTNCPQCKSPYIRYFGIGTQKIEELTRKEFPMARILRLDRDTTTTKNSHQKILDEFSKENIDILIGTQMVAKGHDFPKVTLIGILSADTSLNLPDFRAGEKTFQLITQVAGRAGRTGLKSIVIVQTYSPEHPSIISARDYNFQNIFKQEIQERKILNYPPFTNLISIIISDLTASIARDTSHKISEYIKLKIKNNKGIELLGPVPAVISKIKNFYRFQILIKSNEPDFIKQLLKETFINVSMPTSVKININVDPVNML